MVTMILIVIIKPNDSNKNSNIIIEIIVIARGTVKIVAMVQ